MKKSLFLCLITLASNCFAQRVVLDSSFGDSGVVVSKVKADVQKIKSLPDGKILCLGTYPNNKGVDQPALIKFDGKGMLDSTFCQDGFLQDTIVKLNGFPGLYPPSNFTTVQPDGRIYMASSTPKGSFYKTIISCYDTNGNPILTFGKSGLLELDTIDYVYRGFLNTFTSCQDNKIIVCWNGYYTKYGLNYGDIIAKFDSTGCIDRSFGTEGFLFNGYSSTRFSMDVITVLKDGSIICAGSDHNVVINQRTALIKLNPDGTFNNNFGIGGKVIIDVDPSDKNDPFFNSYLETVRNVIELDDHRMIVSTTTNKKTGDYLIRLMPDGSQDKTFGDNGVTKLITHINDLAVRADGSIYAITENQFHAFTSNGVTDSTMNLKCPFSITCINMLNQDCIILGGLDFIANTTYYSIAKYTIGPPLPVSVIKGETKAVSIFPTSFKDVITFQSDNTVIQNIIIYDLNGKCVLSRTVLDKSCTLNVDLVKGVYLCKIVTTKGVEFHKIISTGGLD